MSKTTNLLNKQEASNRLGGSGGKACSGPLRATLFRSGLPKVAFLHRHTGRDRKTLRGADEGGLLLPLSVTSPMNILNSLLDLWQIKKKKKNTFVLPSSPVMFIRRMRFEFNKTVSCHADASVRYISVQPKEQYRLR